jgi:hypothetical protein
LLTVACVLRSGGDYHPWHVAWLHSQIARHLPGARFVCLSDILVTCERVPLLYDWPGWWAKMELFRPDIQEDILFFDLDTVIVGDLSAAASVGRTTVLRDPNAPDIVNSAVMYLTEPDRARVWQKWISDPAGHMKRCSPFGDQAFIGEVLHGSARWQDVLPGALLSYKIDILKGLSISPESAVVPADCVVVYFHGRPRPWHITVDWLPRPAQAQWSDLDAGLVDSFVHGGPQNDRLHAIIDQLRGETHALRAEREVLRREADALRTSTSWRLTYPMRIIADACKRAISFLPP